MTLGGRPEDCADIVVAGGGPAGSAFAFRLAQLGYDVRQIAGPRHPVADRLEILPPGIAALADVVPVAPALAQAAEPVLRKFLRWAAADASPVAQDGSVVVRRGRFDAILLEQARQAGARVTSPGTARRPWRDGGFWIVPIQAGRDCSVIRARFFADATGRVRGLGRANLPVAPPTLAITTRWSAERAVAGTLLVEAARDGWCWGTAAADGTFESTVFVDAAADTKQTRSQLLTRQMEILRRTSLFAPVLHNARVLRTWFCDATPRQAAEPAGAHWIKLGDSALSADPMSSQGVQAALRSGLHAAAVVHTILSGGDLATAVGFYRNTLADVAQRQRAFAAVAYGDYANDADCSFWHRRQARPALQPKPERSTGPVTAECVLVLAEAAVISAQPALVNDRIGLVSAIHIPAQNRSASWLNGIGAAALMSGLCGPRKAGEIACAWAAHMPPDEAWSLLVLLTENGVFEKTAV